MNRITAVALASSLALACTTGSGKEPAEASPDAAPAPPDDPPPIEETPVVCAEAHVAVAEAVPTVQLLIDRSGTMDQDFGSMSRWQAVHYTLMDPDQGVVRRLDDRMRFGLTTYTADAGTPCPLLHTVEPALDNLPAMDALYRGLDPLDETPTAPALDAMRVQLSALDVPGPKVIVLATDGEPDTCAVPDPDGLPEARAAAVAAAQAAHEAGIDVYVISVGLQISTAHLQDLANAGVGLPVGGPELAPYYQALDPDQLIAAFDAVIGGTRSCSFDIEGTIDPAIAAGGSVTLDGAPLVFGVDWRLVDGDTIEILGDACTVVLGGGDHTIDAEFTCPG